MYKRNKRVFDYVTRVAQRDRIPSVVWRLAGNIILLLLCADDNIKNAQTSLYIILHISAHLRP